TGFLTCLTFAHIMAPRTGAGVGARRAAVFGRTQGEALRAVPRRRVSLAAALALAALAASCSGFPGSNFWSGAPPPPAAQPGTALGTGQVKVALILPASASGNACPAAPSMLKSAQLALSACMK